MAGEQGQFARSIRLWGAAVGIIETTRMQPILRRIHEIDAIVSNIRTRLSEVTFATIQAQGRATPLDRVNAYALAQD